MDDEARDLAHLDDIVTFAKEALAYMDGVSAATYQRDRGLQLKIERLLELIGEAAGNLSEQTREDIPYRWRAVRGLRNVLAHQYRLVVHDRVHQVVVGQLPGLIDAIEQARS